MDATMVMFQNMVDSLKGLRTFPDFGSIIDREFRNLTIQVRNSDDIYVVYAQKEMRENFAKILKERRQNYPEFRDVSDETCEALATWLVAP